MSLSRVGNRSRCSQFSIDDFGAFKEEEYFPQVNWFLDAFHTHFKPLAGYTPTNNFSAGEMLSLSKMDVC